MELKEIYIKSTTSSSLRNELLFEIASQRVGGAELIRFIIINKGDLAAYNRIAREAQKYLRSFKTKGLIQFFATAESFVNNKTESQYLINKYPHLFENIPTTDEGGFFIYVKL
ncbi:MAG: hypothetical protein J6Q67_02725 [Clostridia bacterium]|nr:hypothetical protein [Clostridia bacterium]